MSKKSKAGATKSPPVSAQIELLRGLLDDSEPPRHRQVFVNRALRMGSIEVIGFDLDWTLADYHRLAVEQLAFECARDRLIEEHGYPSAILAAEFRPYFPRRGLLIDKREGCIVKMSRHRYVGRAYLGRRQLPARERNKLYRGEPIDPDDGRFYRADTLFELPELNLFAEIVELSFAKPPVIRLESYEKLFDDIRAAIDSIHRDDTLKSKILSDLHRFLPRDKALVLTLERLRLHGRKLMVLTNSEYWYTKEICAYLFEGLIPGVDHWQDLFDLVVCRTRKPSFFRKETPFTVLDESGEANGDVAVPEWGKIYEGGNRQGLMELLDVPGERVLYVGDHIYGDVVASKQGGTWRTALIVRELEEELLKRDQMEDWERQFAGLKSEIAAMGLRMDDLRDVIDLYDRLDGKVPDLDPELFTEIREELGQLEEEHRQLRQLTLSRQQRISNSYNPMWGSLFKQGSNKSLFGAQVDDFACIYTSRVLNLGLYGSNHYYRVLKDPMMHEHGS